MLEVLIFAVVVTAIGFFSGRIVGAKAYALRTGGRPIEGGFLFFIFITSVCLVQGYGITVFFWSDYLYQALILALIGTYLSLFGFFLGHLVE